MGFVRLLDASSMCGMAARSESAPVAFWLRRMPLKPVRDPELAEKIRKSSKSKPFDGVLVLVTRSLLRLRNSQSDIQLIDDYPRLSCGSPSLLAGSQASCAARFEQLFFLFWMGEQ